MKIIYDNILSLLITLASFAIFSPANAQVVKTQTYKTHYRVEISTLNDKVFIENRENKVYLETLDWEFYEQLRHDLKDAKLNHQYVTGIDFKDNEYPEKPAQIIFSLKDQYIDVFSFYKDKQKKYFIDFWTNSPEIKISKKKMENIKKVKKDIQEKVSLKKAPKIKKKKKTNVIKKISNTSLKYRDFRYGAALIWNYSPLLPEHEKSINIHRKTPDFLYAIKNRDFTKNDQQSHLQLTLNLYKDGKYGLMTKSIQLYRKKYGHDSEIDFHEYLEACALLRKNFKKYDKLNEKVAINLLTNVLERSRVYDQKNAISKYLIEYYLENENYLLSLQSSKKLYVLAKEQFDEEDALYAAKSILFSLSKLEQIEKIEIFLKDKNIKTLLPDQLMLAYRSYIYLKEKMPNKIIAMVDDNKKMLKVPWDPALLFNYSEALFENSEFDKSIQYFDKFIKYYSFFNQASYARIRIAMAFEILEKDIKKTIALYEEAINKVSIPEIRYEAKIRYVGIRLARNKNLSKEDREIEVFLEADKAEKAHIDNKLKKLLWLVRLRLLINYKRYNDALAYLETIPLDRVRPTERRIFEGDGSEIIYGLINKNYDDGNYGKVIKLWETYRNVYFNKVANNPSINFVVSFSYLKLGLLRSFNRSLAFFDKLKNLPVKRYPNWIREKQKASVDEFVLELKLLNAMNSKNWKKSQEIVTQLKQKYPDFYKTNYYSGLLYFQTDKYKEAIVKFEQFLITNKEEHKTLTKFDIYRLFHAYIEALFSVGSNQKFRKNAKAILKDLANKNYQKSYFDSLEQRIKYLIIESLYSENDFVTYSKLAQTKINKFIEEYSDSIYIGRIKYLLGNLYVKSEQYKDAQNVFSELINNKTTPKYIKDMAVSELTGLKFMQSKI